MKVGNMNINACPICGQEDKLDIMDLDGFMHVVNRCGSGLVSIGCTDCHVQVSEFGTYNEAVLQYEFEEYESMLEKCADKWNRLRYEKNLEGIKEDG